MRKLPPIIQEVGFDFSWDERKVWKLQAETEDLSIDALAWHLDIPFLWSKPDGYYDVTPRSVIDHPSKHAGEYERMMHADTRYPIDIMFYKGRWVILDGLHRLMRSVSDGVQTVRVRKIPAAAIPLIQK
ncbi:MAG: hypothetical protein ABWY71_01225 [Candidatus Saccharimonadales bacterium]